MSSWPLRKLLGSSLSMAAAPSAKPNEARPNVGNPRRTAG